MYPVQSPSSQPPAAPSWSSEDGADTTSLPSWMAPRAEEEPLPTPPPAPSRPAGAVVASAIDDPEAAAAEAALYDQATRLSLPPMTPPPSIAPEVTAALEAELDRTREQLAAALAEAERFQRQVLEASERQLVELALAISERVVGRELSLDPTLVAAWAKEGIRALAGQGSISMRVSADVKASLDKYMPGDASSVSVDVDDALPPASCRLQGSLGAVDASLAARLDAVADALGVSERPAAAEGEV